MTLFIFFKYLEDKQKIFNMLIKKVKKKHTTILRAPYRYKIARNQFNIVNYKVRLEIKLDVQDLTFDNIKKINDFINVNKQYYTWFESNIIIQHKVRLLFFAKLNDNFKLLNYFKN